MSIKRVIYEVSWMDGAWFTDDKQQAIAKRRVLEDKGNHVRIYIHKLRLKELMRFACNLLNQQDCFYFQGELTDE